MSSKTTRSKPPLPFRIFGKGWSLAVVLTGWYAISSFTLILGATGLLYWALTSNLDFEDDLFLADRVVIIRHLLKVKPGDTAALENEILRGQLASPSAQFYARLLDGYGTVLFETPGFGRQLSQYAFPAPVAPEVEPQRGVEAVGQSGRVLRALSAKAVVGSPGSSPQQGDVRVIQVAIESA